MPASDALTGAGGMIKGVLVPHPASARTMGISRSGCIGRVSIENFNAITGVTTAYGHG